MSDRGIHPDLVEETLSAQQAPAEAPADAQTAAAGRRASRSRRAAPPPETSVPEPEGPGPDQEPLAEDAQASSPELPEWFAQVREAADPAAALRVLAKNLPSEALSKDEVLSGLIGQMGERRARQVLEQQDRDRQEQAKREAAEKNDLYTLGELSQREILERARADAAAQASGPFMDGVTLFQQSLPEAVQKRVSGQSFGVGKTYAAGVQEYLQALTDEAVKLGVEQEIRRRESALRKSVLSEVNGEEPVPEREGGTPSRVREVTDEQIANMTLAEYDALFDKDGRPKPGVRHRSTRGIPIRSH